MYETKEAARVAHICVRHFQRLSEEIGLKPKEFRGTSRIKLYWTMEQIEKVKNARGKRYREG